MVCGVSYRKEAFRGMSSRLELVTFACLLKLERRGGVTSFGRDFGPVMTGGHIGKCRI